MRIVDLWARDTNMRADSTDQGRNAVIGSDDNDGLTCGTIDVIGGKMEASKRAPRRVGGAIMRAQTYSVGKIAMGDTVRDGGLSLLSTTAGTATKRALVNNLDMNASPPALDANVFV